MLQQKRLKIFDTRLGLFNESVPPRGLPQRVDLARHAAKVGRSGLGRIVALYYCPSSLYHIIYTGIADTFDVSISEKTMRVCDLNVRQGCGGRGELHVRRLRAGGRGRLLCH